MIDSKLGLAVVVTSEYLFTMRVKGKRASTGECTEVGHLATLQVPAVQFSKKC